MLLAVLLLLLSWLVLLLAVLLLLILLGLPVLLLLLPVLLPLLGVLELLLLVVLSGVLLGIARRAALATVAAGLLLRDLRTVALLGVLLLGVALLGDLRAVGLALLAVPLLRVLLLAVALLAVPLLRRTPAGRTPAARTPAARTPAGRSSCCAYSCWPYPCCGVSLLRRIPAADIPAGRTPGPRTPVVPGHTPAGFPAPAAGCSRSPALLALPLTLLAELTERALRPLPLEDRFPRRRRERLERREDEEQTGRHHAEIGDLLAERCPPAEAGDAAVIHPEGGDPHHDGESAQRGEGDKADESDNSGVGGQLADVRHEDHRQHHQTHQDRRGELVLERERLRRERAIVDKADDGDRAQQHAGAEQHPRQQLAMGLGCLRDHDCYPLQVVMSDGSLPHRPRACSPRRCRPTMAHLVPPSPVGLWTPRLRAPGTLGVVRITVLAGGIGAARFLRGLLACAPDADVTVIGNTGDDLRLYGLRVSPDLDTVMYTLGGGNDEARGWGRADETWRALAEIQAYDAVPSWFGLGDLDIGTHLVRTALLADGRTLSEATDALTTRWNLPVRLVPMTDDRVETHVLVEDHDVPDGRRRLHFQEYWVRHHAELPVVDIWVDGIETSRPAPGVLEAIATADVLLLPPSNPVVSIGPILAVPGVRDAVAATPAPVVGLSPIVGGAPVRGMADKLLPAIGVDTSAAGVALHFGARSAGGLLDGWLVDVQDTQAVPRVEQAGIAARAVPLLMTDTAAAAAMARAALDLAEAVRR